MNTTFIADNLREQESDLVFLLPFRDADETEVMIYILIEHQSTVDPAMGFRLLFYLLIFFQRSTAEHERLTGIVSEYQKSLGFSGEEAALMQSMAAYYLEQGKAEGREQGKAEGREQGKAEGREQGKAEGIAAAYRQWQAWNTRRMEAEAEGKPFDEPPPTLPKMVSP